MTKDIYTIEEINGAVSGTIINRDADMRSVMTVEGISTDTRTIGAKDLFVALRGEKFDGHDFIANAADKGVRAFLVSDEKRIPDGCVGILVEDTLVAYGLIAKMRRFDLKARVIAVTGSVGKTTTREMITLALSGSGKARCTRDNFNNEIGLPATILAAPSDTDYLVLEMGMRLRGEISYLTNIACPDIGVITNIGYSHIERLGSREEIRNAKMEITEGIRDGGFLVINGDDEFLRDHAVNNLPMGKLPAVVTTGRCEGQILSVRSEDLRYEKALPVFDAVIDNGGNEIRIKDVRLSVLGMHNVRNALVALMCTYLAGGDVHAAAEKLREYEEFSGRGSVTDTGRYIIIDDAYNAAPDSMKAAFERLGCYRGFRRTVAVLGGMLELGDVSEELHREIGRECGRYDFDRIIVTGEFRGAFAEGLNETSPGAEMISCEDTEEVRSVLRGVLEDGDAVLFKASNAFGFSSLAADLKEA